MESYTVNFGIENDVSFVNYPLDNTVEMIRTYPKGYIA